jgi:hypothetical protein
MKNWILLIITFLMVSCSTYKKTIMYSALSGGVAGGMAGAALSPDSYSRPHNTVIFATVGAVTAGLIGHLLYNEDPRNKKFDNLTLDDEEKLKWEKKNSEELNVGPVNINLELDNKEKYKIPESNLPDNLKDKVSKPYVIRHTSPEKVIKNKDGHTLYIPSFDVYEHTMEQN